MVRPEDYSWFNDPSLLNQQQPVSSVSEGDAWDHFGLGRFAKAGWDVLTDNGALFSSSNTSSASTVPETVNTSSASELRGDLDFGDAESDLGLIGTDSLAYQLEQQRRYNEEQAEIAYQRQRDFRKTYYADLVEGMKVAGLNPMLLAHVGYSGSTVPQASSQAIGGDTWSDLVNASASKHNSYSQRLTSIAALIGASASVLSAIADFLPTSAAPVKRAVGFQVK